METYSDQTPLWNLIHIKGEHENFQNSKGAKKNCCFFVFCFLLLITRIPFWVFMHNKAPRAGKYIIYFLSSSIVVSSGRPDSDSTRQWTAAANGHRRTHSNLSTAIAILDGECHGHSVQWNSNWLCCWWFHGAFALFATRGREAHQDHQRYSSGLLTILGRKWSVIEFFLSFHLSRVAYGFLHCVRALLYWRQMERPSVDLLSIAAKRWAQNSARWWSLTARRKWTLGTVIVTKYSELIVQCKRLKPLQCCSI